MTARFRQTAAAAWGEVPAWVAVLAAHADRSGLAAAAAAIGYSKTAVSLVIQCRYGADTARLRSAVEERLGVADTQFRCPVLGPIDPTRCQSSSAAAGDGRNQLAAMLRDACRSCPHAKGAHR